MNYYKCTHKRLSDNILTLIKVEEYFYQNNICYFKTNSYFNETDVLSNVIKKDLINLKKLNIIS